MAGEIQPFFLADLPVTEGHTGDGVTENIINGLKPYNIDSDMFQEQFTAHAYDGQYFGLYAPAELCTKTKTNIYWALPGWDAAHRLELMLKDCRTDAECSLEPLPHITWYALLATAVSEIQLRWKYGKRYEELRVEAEGMRRQLLNPQTFCDTRFAQAEQKVYYNFMRNWDIFVSNLTALSTRRGETTAKKREAREHLDKLLNFTFVGQLMGMVDILAHTRDLSLAMQTVNMLPWELVEAQDSWLAKMQTMYEELTEERLPADLFPFCMKEHRWENLCNGVFYGYTLLGAGSVAVEDLYESLANICQCMIAFFRVRFLQDEHWQVRFIRCLLDCVCCLPVCLPECVAIHTLPT